MKSKYTKEILQEVVINSKSMREVLSSLELAYTGGNYSHIKKLIKYYNIDYSHFSNQSWRKNKTFDKKSIETYLNNEAFIGSDALKKRLIKEGYFDKTCQKCNNSLWLDDEIPLELHHIDGNHSNNQLSNLQLLCSNCHTYTHRQKRKLQIKSNQTESLIITKVKTRKSRLKPEKRKVERPSLDVLLHQVDELGYVQTGKLYNVSDNAIRKWIRMYKKHT